MGGCHEKTYIKINVILKKKDWDYAPLHAPCNKDKRMVTMDIYGMQGSLDNVTLRQVNLTENIICIKKLTINLLIRYMENNWDIKKHKN